MITGSYDLDTVEEALDIVLKIDLTLKRLVNIKTRILSVRDIYIMIISAPRRVDMLELCLVIILMIQWVLRMSIFFLRFVENTLVDSTTPVIEEVHVLSVVPVMTWMS